MAEKLPWFSFYARDWLSDGNLQMCSLAARGLWIQLLTRMHLTSRPGYLSDKPLSPQQLAALVGAPVEEVQALLQELLDAGVPSITEDGILYSRRMVADEQYRNSKSEAGQRGGQAKAKQTPGKQAGKSLAKAKQTPGKQAGKSLASETETETHTETQPEPEPEEAKASSGGEAFASPSADGETPRAASAPPKGGGVGEPIEADETDFDRFWSAYPRKTAKQDALKAWRRLAPDPALLAIILTALDTHKHSDQWTRDGGRFIPHPATWLNGRRWEDAPPPSRDDLDNERLFGGIRDWLNGQAQPVGLDGLNGHTAGP